MTKEKINEKAHEIAWQISKHYDPNACKEEWCEMAAKDMADWLLDNLWINVEDELPTFEESVLVRYKWRTTEAARFGHRSNNKMVIVDKNGFCNCIEDEVITHWMPIPKLNKE